MKDAAGNVTEVHCTYDPASRGGNSPDGRKVKSTMHWVSAAHAISAEIRLYDKLFSKPDPFDFPEGGDIFDNLNPGSLEVLTGAKLEPSLANAKLKAVSSSSALDISVWTQTRPEPEKYLTGHSRSKIPGPRSRRRPARRRNWRTPRALD